MQLSFQRVFYVLASIIGLFAILILAKGVLIPLAFAFLIAFILFPVAKRLERWGSNVLMAAFLAILALFIIIAGSIFLFSNQIIELSKNITSFQDKILKVFADATLYINENMEFLPRLNKTDLINQIQTWLTESSGTLLSQTFSGTAEVLFGLLTSVVFTFLILIYRDGLVRALVRFFPGDNRERAFSMFKSLQKIGQRYLFGMIIIVLILGMINSVGLWIIGIDSPFLFGFLAALLALIPYAGTFLGAAIPVLYAFMSYGSIWTPITIAIFFWLVQVVESNFLTPKIVGGNLQINALTSILSIIIGASVWGIAGMILFLPFTAMFKVVCEEYAPLRPIALLIGEENYQTGDARDRSIVKILGKLKNWLTKIWSSRA